MEKLANRHSLREKNIQQYIFLKQKSNDNFAKEFAFCISILPYQLNNNLQVLLKMSDLLFYNKFTN